MHQLHSVVILSGFQPPNILDGCICAHMVSCLAQTSYGVAYVSLATAGYQHSIALTAGGHVLTWGIGENGQLGRISISLRHPKAFEGEALLVKFATAGLNLKLRSLCSGPACCWQLPMTLPQSIAAPFLAPLCSHEARIALHSKLDDLDLASGFWDLGSSCTMFTVPLQLRNIIFMPHLQCTQLSPCVSCCVW